MAFRPAPLLSLFTLAALAVLISLGLWQLQRMAQRTAIFEQVAARALAPALTANDLTIASDPAARAGLQAIEFRRISATIDAAPATALFGAAARSYQRARLSDGRLVLAETGVHGAGLPVGAAFEAMLRVITPDPDLPADDPAKALYFQPGDSLAASLGVPIPATVFLAAPTLATPAGVTLANPRADPRESTPGPERNLGYALTWFGLAIGLVGVYVLLHVRMGRLTATRR